MASTVRKFVNTFTTIFTTTSLIFIFIKTISDKSTVLDFLTDTFKYNYLFYVFILLLILFSITLSLDIKDKVTIKGFRKDDNKVEYQQRQRNYWIKVARIITGVLTSVCLLLLIFLEFQTYDLGFYGTSFSNNNLHFNQQLTAKVRDSARIAAFGFHLDSKMPYREDPEIEDRLFKRFYKRGVLYTGQYDNTTRDSIINLELKWIGKGTACQAKEEFIGEFSKSTVDVNADADLIANFILGFANMHICNSEKAILHYMKVYKSIKSTESSSIRARLMPLKDTVVKYICRMVAVSAYSQNSRMPATPFLLDTTNSIFKDLDPADRYTIASYLQQQHLASDTSETLMPTKKDVQSGTFCTMSGDSVSRILEAVDIKGNLYLNQPGSNKQAKKFSLFPVYIYERDGEYYVAYKHFAADSFFSFLNLKTMDEARHSLSPFKPDQIEQYIRTLYPTSKTFKFESSAKINVSDPFIKKPIQITSSSQRKPFITCSVSVQVWQLLREHLTMLEVSRSQPGTFSIRVRNIYDKLSNFPVIIEYGMPGNDSTVLCEPIGEKTTPTGTAQVWNEYLQNTRNNPLRRSFSTPLQHTVKDYFEILNYDFKRYPQSTVFIVFEAPKFTIEQ